MAFDDLLNDLEQRRAKTLAMGGPDKRRAAGVLNARERLDYLFDKGTFVESGLFGTEEGWSQLKTLVDKVTAF